MDREAVRRSVFRYILYLSLGQAGIALFLAFVPGPRLLGLGYLAGALPWTVLVGLVLARNVHMLYTVEGRPLERLNPATRITLLRVICVPLLVALILTDHMLAATGVFLAAAITDWLDGFLARRMKDVTQLGRIIDPMIDAVFCGLTLLALFFAGQLPLWVLLVGALRYGLLTVGAAYIKLRFGYVAPEATFAGRMFYLLQYSLLTLLLLLHDAGAAIWLQRGIGALQIIVFGQLVGLGLGMIREADDVTA